MDSISHRDFEGLMLRNFANTIDCFGDHVSNQRHVKQLGLDMQKFHLESGTPTKLQ